MKIAVLHATMNAVRPLEDALRQEEPNVQIVNLVNEELLRRANEMGGVDPAGLRAFLRLAAEAADARPDGIIIACTIYTPYVEWVRQLTEAVVIAVDQPMIDRAISSGKKIGILATTPASAPAALDKLKKAAKGAPLKTETSVVPEAMTALKAGNLTLHNELLRAAGERLVEKGCQVLLLSQITMACAAENMKTLAAEVLSSPQTGAEEILKRIREKER